jgi:hypothetical protein
MHPSAIAGKRLRRFTNAPVHFQVESAICRGYAIVRRHPMGHHDAVESPVLAHDFRVQVTILRCVLAVDQVVRIHDRADVRLLHRSFKRGKIDFAQRAFIDKGIGIIPQIFGIVGQEVLDSRGNALRLHSLDIPNRDRRCEERIFPKIFEIAAISRARDKCSPRVPA